MNDKIQAMNETLTDHQPEKTQNAFFVTIEKCLGRETSSVNCNRNVVLIYVFPFLALMDDMCIQESLGNGNFFGQLLTLFVEQIQVSFSSFSALCICLSSNLRKLQSICQLSR